jgi:hydroxyacylglutathione hydrolase
MLEIIPFTLGPVETNAYLIADGLTGEAVVIDPAWDGQKIVEAAEERSWSITQVWLTHAHFDHIAGTEEIVRSLTPAPGVALHPDDLPLYQMQGGAMFFGMHIDPGPEPTITLKHLQKLRVGEVEMEVRHAPGHTPGHVIFYCAGSDTLFCGDVIFMGSVGRTDLPGGNYERLMQSIETQVLSLPDRTRLLCGHGPETTVGAERNDNPFIR